MTERRRGVRAVDRDSETWWQALAVGGRLLRRLAAMALLIVAYVAVKWKPLRKGLRSGISFALQRLGHHVAYADTGPELLAVDAEPYEITANCTYLDLFLTLAPFCWRRALPPAVNLRRLSLLAAAVLLGNVVRVSLALHLNADGMPWGLAHTVPDTLIRSIAVGGCVIAAVRDDWEGVDRE